QHQVVVRRGKGQKDRLTMLPIAIEERLKKHLQAVKRLHERDLAGGFGRVVLPCALDRKYPNAATEWGWQFAFPAARICRDPQFGPAVAVSPARVRGAAGGGRGSPQGRHRET